PEPEGPSRAISSPVATSRLTLSSATKFFSPPMNSFRIFSTLIPIVLSFFAVAGLAAPEMPPLPPFLEQQRDEGKNCQKRRDRKGRGKVIFVVENLDMQRDGVGQPANMPRDHGNRAEFPHRAGVTKKHAVKQRPFDVGERDIAEGLPPACAKKNCGLLLVIALLLHQRDQLARNEGEGNEDRGEHDTGHGEE